MPIRLSKGMASVFLVLIWSSLGGILQHAFNSNLLSIIVSPVFEKPMDTAQDILEAGLSPILRHKGNLLSSPNPAFAELAKRALVTKDTQPTQLIIEKVLNKRTHAWMVNFIPRVEYLHYDFFHMSKETIGFLNQWYVMLVNKKWNQKENFEKHILRFQQVYLKETE